MQFSKGKKENRENKLSPIASFQLEFPFVDAKPGVCRGRIFGVAPRQRDRQFFSSRQRRDNATDLFFQRSKHRSKRDSATAVKKKKSKNFQAKFEIFLKQFFYFKNFWFQRKNKISLSTSVSSFALNLLKTMLRCENNRSDVTSVTGTEIISRAIEPMR